MKRYFKGGFPLFFTFLILLFFIYVLAIIFSKIEIKIDKLYFDSENKLNNDYNIQISIIGFYFLKILKVKFNKKKINKLIGKIKNNNLLKNIKLNFKFSSYKKYINNTKYLNFKIRQIDVNVFIGVQDAFLTAVLNGLTLSIFGCVIRNNVNSKIKYNVRPLYGYDYILKLNLNGIFSINLIHYIYKVFIERRKNNEGKSSNRRSYAYSNE